METSINDIETLFYQKIETYEQLVDLFTQERKSLESADIEAMWRYSDQKQKISNRIVEIRMCILTILNKFGILHDMNATTFHTPKIISLVPKKQGRNLQKIYVSLITIKNKVRALSEENKKFVEDYLGILDELIGIITNAGKPKPVYDSMRNCNAGKKTNLLLHKEV
ncbi:MAG: hypothetical protein C0403_00300 [Desulfobacterium sp.]|nr:hypothetical protein [Desulfobacterium sp.]